MKGLPSQVSHSAGALAPMIPYEQLASEPAARPAQSADAVLQHGWILATYPSVRLDAEIQWDLRRVEERSWNYAIQCWNMLNRLLHAHAATSSDQYLTPAVRVALDWAARHRDPKEPGQAPFAWYDMAVGMRAYRLAYIIDAASRAGLLDAGAQGILWGALEHHRAYLANDSNIVFHNNHGFYQVAGQFAMGRRFAEVSEPMAEAAASARLRMHKLLERQFTSDGVHREHSPEYHRMVCATLRAIIRAGLIEDAEVRAFADRVESSLSWFVMPNGHLANFGDSDHRLVSGGSAFSRTRWQSAEMRYVSTGGAAGRLPAQPVAAFGEGGYFIVRQPSPTASTDVGQFSYLAQMTGFHSRTHKHADDLSVIWSDRGSSLLVDAGRYGYLGKATMGSDLWRDGHWYTDPFRIYCESTRAHNTLEFDGLNYPRRGVKPYGSALRRWLRHESGLVVVESECRHFRTIRRARVLLFMPGRWLLVFDWFQDNAKADHVARQWFHLAPELAVERDGAGYRAEVSTSTTPLRVVPLLDVAVASEPCRGQMEPAIQGWWCPSERVAVPNAAFCFESGPTTGGSFATLFSFSDELAAEPTMSKVSLSGRNAQFRWRDESGINEIRLRRPAEGEMTVAWQQRPAEAKAAHSRAGEPGPPPPGRPAPDTDVLSTPDLRVACVLDPFSFASFEPECRLLQLTPENWERELEDFRPQLLLIESAWGGKGELWTSKIGQKSREVRDIVAWCRAHAIPAAFWNKEDPVHFSTFIDTASLFDVVFTTDADCIPAYKAMLRHDRVHLLPFACQPAIHNPVERYERRDAFCFAGAYYTRYPERMRDLEDFVQHLPAFRPLEIFDRNFEKTDPRYAFPERYRSHIVGSLPFERIDEAYKGYRFAVNLNSVKTSQTMFARRVYELMACNTLVVSNYARGLRILFGDLVLAGDSGVELVRRLKDLVEHGGEARVRLAALRRVMTEHTYRERLGDIVSKAFGVRRHARRSPNFAVIGRAAGRRELAGLLAVFGRQQGVTRSLVVVVPDGADLGMAVPDETIRVVTESSMHSLTLGQLAGDAADWVAVLSPEDHYGANYLKDFEVAMRYSGAAVIGKAARHVLREGRIIQETPESTYRVATGLLARSAVISRADAGRIRAADVILVIADRRYETADQFAIDPFNYCAGGGSAADAAMVSATVDDLTLDIGLEYSDLVRRTENMPAAPDAGDGGLDFSARDLARRFGWATAPALTLLPHDGEWEIVSDLDDGRHTYLYAVAELTQADLARRQDCDGALRLHLETTPGLQISLVLRFLDDEGGRIDHAILASNRNHTVTLPSAAVAVQLGLRVLGSGRAHVRHLRFSHRDLSPPVLLGRSDCLLVTNAYPTYGDLYRNAFVHTRVVGYAARGASVDVFRLRQNEPVSFQEFEGIDVTVGSEQALRAMIASGRHARVLVHFLDDAMWRVLREVIPHTKVVIWLHGAEIQLPWRRNRGPTIEGSNNRDAYDLEEKRKLWNEVLRLASPNLHFVFVSDHLARETMEDYGVTIAPERYSVIHNPIDTDLFSYAPRGAEQRHKILSIRPYTSTLYANDLSVQAILRLSEASFFEALSFTLVGDGRLFDATTAPLRGFCNVSIERRFLHRREIAELHRTHGVFLCPTRADTQGVSRDEAMSSGLVPVTTCIAAVPEFVDGGCGILGRPEQAEDLASGIEALYRSPELFLRMSASAAARVRRQSASHLMLEREIALFRNTPSR